MALIVHKYGGTSMGSVERIRNVALRVAKWHHAGHRMVVVPSAMSGETASDMPCCPSKAPVPFDCSKCVLMAACMSKCFTGITVTVVHPFRNLSDSIALRLNDSRPDGLGHTPPEHPPRTLV